MSYKTTVESFVLFKLVVFQASHAQDTVVALLWAFEYLLYISEHEQGIYLPF